MTSSTHSNIPCSVAILAGGLATRLHPLTMTQPKSLLLVNNEPFIAHQLRLLRSNNISRVVICSGHLGEQISDFVGDGRQFDLEISYSNDGPALLGTAGALKKALPMLSDEFFILYGDSYLPCNYSAIYQQFIQSNKLALMALYKNQGKWDQSNVELKQGEIITYDKVNRHSNMHYIDYGLGLVRKKAFEFVPSNQAYDLAHFYQKLLSLHELSSYEVGHRFYEIGSFNGINDLSHYLHSLEKNLQELS